MVQRYGRGALASHPGLKERGSTEHRVCIYVCACAESRAWEPAAYQEHNSNECCWTSTPKHCVYFLKSGLLLIFKIMSKFLCGPLHYTTSGGSFILRYVKMAPRSVQLTAWAITLSSSGQEFGQLRPWLPEKKQWELVYVCSHICVHTGVSDGLMLTILLYNYLWILMYLEDKSQ